VDRLDAHYARLLHFGLLGLREAIALQDLEWANAETEFLHEIPTLIGEQNVQRHRWFWFTIRDLYIGWVKESGHERVQSRMRTYYEPLWREMEPILLDAFSHEPIVPQVSTAGSAAAGPT
jgi:hypothetical protein